MNRHQVARRLNQHIPSCVSGVRASLLKHALEPPPAFTRFGDCYVAYLVCVCGDKALGHQRRFTKQLRKFCAVDGARPLERGKV